MRKQWMAHKLSDVHASPANGYAGTLSSRSTYSEAEPIEIMKRKSFYLRSISLFDCRACGRIKIRHYG